MKTQASSMKKQEKGTVILLHRYRKIEMYEVMKNDLLAYRRASRRSEVYFGLFTGSAGALLSCVLSWLGTSSENPIIVATFASVSVVLTLATLFFMTVWWLERKDLPDLLEKAERFTIEQ